MGRRDRHVRPGVLARFIRGAALAPVAGVLFLAPALVHAGRSCESTPPSVESIVKGMNLAARTAGELDASGAEVVVLARAGQDLGKYGLKYSLLGLAYKAEGGEWRVVHKLNECGTAEAAIYRQGLGEFFLDDLWRYEAAWSVPTEAVQKSLLTRLNAAKPQLLEMNIAPYSIVSYAWGNRYQQSNQWVLETIAAAMEPGTIHRREQAQAWLKYKGYQPTTLAIGPLMRLGGRISSANVAFDDHPADKRYSDRIETITVDSIFAWLPRAGLAAQPSYLRP